MTDKERLQLVLDNCRSQSIEEIFQCFLDSFKNDLSIRTINELHKQIGYCLERKINKLDNARFIANERATFLKTYLEGNMWEDEESAKKNLQPQIKNAQIIIDVCKGI